MLPLWLQGWLTPCPRAARKLGYLREVLNIRRAHGWWAKAWEPHFHRTRATIQQGIDRCRQRRVAVIIGSGWLHDVPLDELAAAFEEVRLVDVIHPLPVRWRVKRLRNVRLVHHDITGTTEAVYRGAEAASGPLPVSAPALYHHDPAVDLVASVNILSQLAYLHVEYLLGRAHSRAEVFAYARQVIRAHLDYLQALPGVKVCIADVARLTINRAGSLVEEVSTLYGEPFPWEGETWLWRLVPATFRPPHDALLRRVYGVVWDTVAPPKLLP
jgi:hypothetical protein